MVLWQVIQSVALTPSHVWQEAWHGWHSLAARLTYWSSVGHVSMHVLSTAFQNGKPAAGQLVHCVESAPVHVAQVEWHAEQTLPSS